MLILILLAMAGFLTCSVAHIQMFFYEYRPNQYFINVLNAGFLSLAVVRIFLSRRFQNDCSITSDQFKTRLESVCPEWLKIGTGFFVIYGALAFTFFLGMAISAAIEVKDSKLTTHKFFHGFFALLMIFYIVEFSRLTCFKLLKKSWDDMDKNI